MKKFYLVIVRIICISALLFSITNVDAQITHAYFVSSGLGSHPAKILYDANNGLALGGYSSFGNDSTYINLMHINSGFTVGSHAEYKLDNPIAWTSDFIKAGNSYLTGGISIGAITTNAFLLKTDTAFNINWAYRFTNLLHGQTGLHNFFYEGNKFTAYSYQTQFYDGMYRISTTVNDTTFEAKEITLTSGGFFKAHDAVKYGQPGEHILCGTASDAAGQDGWIAKIDSAGPVWSYKYDFGGNVQEQMYDMMLTSAGDIITSGVSQVLTNVDTYVSKLDTAGNLIWSTNIYSSTGTLYLKAAAETNQQEILLAGLVGFPYRVALIKLNAVGGIIFARSFTPATGANPNSFIKKPDGSFILVLDYSNYLFIELDSTGNGCDFGNDSSIYVSNFTGTVRTNLPLVYAPFMLTKQVQPVYPVTETYQTSVLCTSTGIEQLSVATGFSLYPQPAHDVLNIVRKENKGKNVLLKVFDIAGKKMIDKSMSDEEHIRLNIASLQAGYYLLQLISETKTYSVKFIVD